MKKRFSMLTALALILLLLAGCAGAGTDQPTDTTSAETAQTVSAQDAGFTLDDVLRVNRVTALISAYGNMQLMHYEGDKLYSESYYFMHGGKLVSTCRTEDPDGESCYSCAAEDTAYQQEGDRLQFDYDLDGASQTPDGFIFDEAVTAQLLDGEIRQIEEPDEDTWLFEIRDDQSPDLVCRCTIDKKTRTISQIDWTYGDGSSSRTEVRCGAQAEIREFGLLDGFSRPLRTIRCVCTLHDKKGKPVEKTYTLKVPDNAEPVWVASREVNVYLDKGFTKEYAYPGNGDGYTVYVTDAMG